MVVEYLFVLDDSTSEVTGGVAASVVEPRYAGTVTARRSESLNIPRRWKREGIGVGIVGLEQIFLFVNTTLVYSLSVLFVGESWVCI